MLFTCFANTCFAQSDTVKSPGLEEMTLEQLMNIKITTASRTPQELDKAPATVIVVTREQITARGYQSLLDVMYDLPDIKVDDKIYSGIRNTFTVRGTQGQEKFVLLLDGIRISSPSGEAMPIMENYPVNLAEQIEIMYGPASALYGADAVSGVINIITKSASSAKGIRVNASSVGGSYGYTNNSLLIAKKITDHASFMVSGQYSYDQGVDYSKLYKNDSSLSVSSYHTGTINSIYGPITPVKPIAPKYEAPIQSYNIYAALNIDGFTFSYFRNDFKVPSAYGNNTSNAIYNKDAFLRQSIDVACAAFKKSIGKITSTTTLIRSEYNLLPSSNYRNLYTNMEPGYKYSTCSMMKVEQQLDFKASEKFNMIAGGSYEGYISIPQSADLQNPVNSNDFIHGSYLGTKSYYRPDGLPAQFYLLTFNNIGTYLQLQYTPVKKINITLGGRYDINSRYGNTFNPRLGLVYKPFRKTSIKLLYGTAFLAPTPSSSYVQYGSFYTLDSGKTYNSYFLHLPNPKLKPITSRSIELSIKQYLTDNFSITLNGYYTGINGLHSFADDAQTTHLYNNMFNGIQVDYVEVFVNQARQQNYGGSMLLNWKKYIRKIQMNTFISLSYVNGKIDNALKESEETIPDAQLEFISPYMLRVGTDFKAGKISCSPRLILIGKQNLNGITDSTGSVMKRQTLPGYTLLNVSIRYTITKHWSVFVNVTNALNQKYKSVGFIMDLNKANTEFFYGQREDPIRIMGGINLIF